MYDISDFSIANGRLSIREDVYELSKIKSVKVVKNKLRSHLVKAFVTSAIASSILWIFEPFATPWGFDINAGVVALAITFPVVFLLSIFRSKYQLQIEFEHQDEVGLQWVTVASGRAEQELTAFKKVEQELLQAVV
ncbi:hypothetical protein ACCH70_004333 [Vibrio vulnificus]|uniref:Uncharacterized protein n=1 Tax=Vibrio vulnificus TaxID=672 RepID=C8BX24_VIBVL|nr:hypothetical protein [Vibrio vulnificus]ACU42682.1 hypothetical protein [Vibrio vulnificus NBRC 15645 = ATCC 27562]ASM97508.1 hypothetical protein AOT11_20595 [Vibrio vulnificus NBRC 15645 = ATCC 27562]EHH0684939.1 hypothetical protein [Vibrio vulnificus]EHH0804888.1 hypothetical protein [Vibrio vulnificus]EHH0850114.1 hypothetical protein [Vibrio vulnificus]